MAFTRRRYKKKIFRRERTGVRYSRRLGVNRNIRYRTVALNNKPHFFTRCVHLGNLNTTVADQYFAMNFTLGGVNTTGTTALPAATAMPGLGDFTSLFDAYKINAVKVMFFPQADVALGGAAVASGQFSLAVDYDDSTAPIAVTDLDQYTNVRFIPTNRVHTVYFKPRCSVPVYGNTFLTNYSQSRSKWIDMASTVVEHYGLKGTIRLAAVNFPSWKVTVKIYFACRQAK